MQKAIRYLETTLKVSLGSGDFQFFVTLSSGSNHALKTKSEVVKIGHCGRATPFN